MHKTEETTNFLRTYLPKLGMPEETKNEILYEIGNEYLPNISKLLNGLESASSMLNIKSWYIKSISTEESYIKFEKEKRNNSPHPLPGSFLDYKPDYKIRPLRSQWCAMLYKKLLFYKYNIRYIVCQYIIILFSAFLLYLTSNRYYKESYLLRIFTDEDTYKDIAFLIDIKDNHSMNLAYKDYIINYFPEVELEEVPTGSTTNDYMLSKYAYGTAHSYYSTFIGGISSEKNVITIWFNNYFFHSIIISQYWVLDAIAKTYLGEKYAININNHPLAKVNSTMLRRSEMDQKIFNAYLIAWFTLCIGLFIISPIKERCMGFVQQQYCHGVRPWVYWLSHLCLDYSIFITIVILYIGLAYSLEIYGFDSMYFVIRITLVLSMFGLASLSFLYFISKKVDSTTSAMGIVYLIYLTFGFMISIFVDGLRELTQHAKTVFNILHYIFLFIPSYGLYSALQKIHALNQQANTCQLDCLRSRGSQPHLCYDLMFGHKTMCEKGEKECCYGEYFKIILTINP